MLIQVQALGHHTYRHLNSGLVYSVLSLRAFYVNPFRSTSTDALTLVIHLPGEDSGGQSRNALIPLERLCVLLLLTKYLHCMIFKVSKVLNHAKTLGWRAEYM